MLEYETKMEEMRQRKLAKEEKQQQKQEQFEKDVERKRKEVIAWPKRDYI